MSESTLWLVRDTTKARKQGPAGLARRQCARLAEMVAFARARSRYYRALYQRLPAEVRDPAMLPVTNKKELMARFDDWVTDRDVTIEQVRAFIEDSARVGERFLGRYTVAITSGTTGTRGVFVLDDRSLRVTNALAVRMMLDWLRVRDFLRIVARRARLTLVMASGGHYASAVAAARLKKRRGTAVQILSVHTPLPELAAALNGFRPAVLAPYASIGALLASEQEANRLHINPVLIVLSAEGLPLPEYDRIAKAFQTKVRHSYAATECPFLSYSCDQGWLHVNSDWVLLEPVDADYRPTPPGRTSYTVLVSNLANRIQPILRYDLGDRILQRADPCPCGNPLPAIRVQGRAADVLVFTNERGHRVALPPLAFEIDHIPGVELFQVVQRTPAILRVRVKTAGDPERVWQAIDAELRRLLVEHKLDRVTVERAEEPPQPSAGGKYRTVIPMR